MRPYGILYLDKLWKQNSVQRNQAAPLTPGVASANSYSLIPSKPWSAINQRVCIATRADPSMVTKPILLRPLLEKRDRMKRVAFRERRGRAPASTKRF